ncbi:YadA-like family protein [Arsenophonus sp. PmNCSU2021_1]|uniref:YadA-like family protein n=1 Tax=Arsenophonus sp. PmNCSU2021_1 TaxID=3118989 RepID=UPI002FF1F077
MKKTTILACAIMGILANVNAEEVKTKGEFSSVLGTTAEASGYASTAIGEESKATGTFSSALGEGAEASGFASTAIGRQSKATGKFSSALGERAEASQPGSTAIGEASKATGKFSSALGAKAEASGYASTAIGEGSKATCKFSLALGTRAEASRYASTAIGEGSKATAHFSSALGRRAEAYGEESTSIGVNSKAANHLSSALGSAAEASGYASTAIGGASKATGKDSIAVGSKSIAQREYTRDITDTLRKQLPYKDALIREFSMGSVVQDNKSSTAGTNVILSQITNVASGTEDTDAVNLYQLNKVKRDVDERIGEVDKIKNDAKDALDVTTQHRDNANLALKETEKHRDNVYGALTSVKMHENSADLLVKRLKREASLVDGKITQSSDGTMYIGKELEGSQIFVSGKQGDRVISGVASGARNSDAVNVSQLNTVRTAANYASQLAQKNSSRINHLEDKLSKTNTKIERGLATSAALTGLFQPYGVGKVNLTASIGGYGASQALAVGTGYRITENAAVKAGVAYSGGNHVMYNSSFNFEW